MRVLLLTTISLTALSVSTAAEDFKRQRDVIYGRKWGLALTMDVFTPKKPNRAAVVFCVSGGWFSHHRDINPGFIQPLLDRGYTVFAVVHGSQPRFTIPEAVADMHRSVRFIRHHAKRFGIDPQRIGITGGSAGGHLSLMIGCAGTAAKPSAADPVDRVSSRVQAVGCFFPPTDFLNYGEQGHIALGRGTLKNYRAPFDFNEFDRKEKRFKVIEDEQRLLKIGREISPAYHATKDDPPTLIVHGDADKLVPIQQAELVIDALKTAGVDTQLVVKKGAAHGWPKMADDMRTIAAWFDKHLAKPSR